jgi:hypothetical protein
MVSIVIIDISMSGYSNDLKEERQIHYEGKSRNKATQMSIIHNKLQEDVIHVL